MYIIRAELENIFASMYAYTDFRDTLKYEKKNCSSDSKWSCDTIITGNVAGDKCLALLRCQIVATNVACAQCSALLALLGTPPLVPLVPLTAKFFSS